MFKYQLDQLLSVTIVIIDRNLCFLVQCDIRTFLTELRVLLAYVIKLETVNRESVS